MSTLHPSIAAMYGITKEASHDDEGIDLNQLSTDELIELAAHFEQEKTAAHEEQLLEKMASDGSLDYFDLGGRIQAHSFFDELNKLASDGEDDEDDVLVNIDELTLGDVEDLAAEGYGLAETGVEKIAMIVPLEKVAFDPRMAAGRVGKAVRSVSGRADKWALAQGLKGAKGARAKARQELIAKGYSPKQVRAMEMGGYDRKGFSHKDARAYLNSQYAASGDAISAADRKLGGGALAAGAAGAAGTSGAIAALLRRKKGQKG